MHVRPSITPSSPSSYSPNAEAPGSTVTRPATATSAAISRMISSPVRPASAPSRSVQSVALDGRPRVLTLHRLPVTQWLHARAHARHTVDVDEAARALPTAAHEPARPVVLEAATEDSHAGGVERRADRVALEAGVRASVEREANGTIPVG